MPPISAILKVQGRCGPTFLMVCHTKQTCDLLLLLLLFFFFCFKNGVQTERPNIGGHVHVSTSPFFSWTVSPLFQRCGGSVVIADWYSFENTRLRTRLPIQEWKTPICQECGIVNDTGHRHRHSPGATYQRNRDAIIWSIHRGPCPTPHSPSRRVQPLSLFPPVSYSSGAQTGACSKSICILYQRSK